MLILRRSAKRPGSSCLPERDDPSSPRLRRDCAALDGSRCPAFAQVASARQVREAGELADIGVAVDPQETSEKTGYALRAAR
jgi:hypothetical protein